MNTNIHVLGWLKPCQALSRSTSLSVYDIRGSGTDILSVSDVRTDDLLDDNPPVCIRRVVRTAGEYSGECRYRGWSASCLEGSADGAPEDTDDQIDDRRLGDGEAA